MSDDKTESVTKAVLAESVQQVIPGITTKKATDIVESIIDEIRDTLAKGEIVKISGFGKFSPHEKKARKGRNPKTGEPITIADRKVLKFKVSEKLKAEMNGAVFNGEE
jgi:integration host factor subunit alpha